MKGRKRGENRKVDRANVIVELPSGKNYAEQDILSIENELINILKGHDVAVCDAKAILESTKQRIDEVTKL